MVGILSQAKPTVEIVRFYLMLQKKLRENLMNNDVKKLTMPFTGNVDELLAHVDSVTNIEELDSVVLNDNEAIKMIMAECDCDESMARDILTEIKLDEVDRVLKNLMADGLVEVKSYSPDGEPQYGLTDNGHILAENLKKTE